MNAMREFPIIAVQSLLRAGLQMRFHHQLAGNEKNLYETTPADKGSLNISRQSRIASRLGKHRPIATGARPSN
jgi:hypothetical protein